MKFEKLDEIYHVLQSLSSRRAWIEIQPERLLPPAGESLSSRRAWIEITSCLVFDLYQTVALLAEGVD